MNFILNRDVCCEEANKVFVSFRDETKFGELSHYYVIVGDDILQGFFINGFTDRVPQKRGGEPESKDQSNSRSAIELKC